MLQIINKRILQVNDDKRVLQVSVLQIREFHELVSNNDKRISKVRVF